MRKASLLAAAVVVGLLVSAAARAADHLGDEQLKGLRAGAGIDQACFEKNVLKDIGACRVAATATEKTPSIMLGLWFHMWFTDVLLSELYRDKKAELSARFQQLADAEFPAVLAYEESLHYQPSELCAILGLDCATAARFHEEWRARLKR